MRAGKGGRGAVRLLPLVDRACCRPRKKLNISERSGERWTSSFVPRAAIVFFTDATPFGARPCVRVRVPSPSVSSVSSRLCQPARASSLSIVPLVFYILVSVLFCLLLATAVLFKVYLVNSFFFFSFSPLLMYIGNMAWRQHASL